MVDRILPPLDLRQAHLYTFWCSIQNSIRKFRFEKNEMTQQQLADAVGVSRQTIVAIEKGNYSPSLELAFKISREFNTPLEKVFSYEPEDEYPEVNERSKKSRKEK